MFSAGQVLCSGADGHNSIEKTHVANHCSTSHLDHENDDHDNLQHYDHDYVDFTDVEDHCEPCVDIPLQSVAKLFDQNQKVNVYGIIESCQLDAIANNINPILEMPFPVQQFRSNQILDELRTIILII